MALPCSSSRSSTRSVCDPNTPPLRRPYCRWPCCAASCTAACSSVLAHTAARAPSRPGRNCKCCVSWSRSKTSRALYDASYTRDGTGVVFCVGQHVVFLYADMNFCERCVRVYIRVKYEPHPHSLFTTTDLLWLCHAQTASRGSPPRVCFPRYEFRSVLRSSQRVVCSLGSR